MFRAEKNKYTLMRRYKAKKKCVKIFSEIYLRFPKDYIKTREIQFRCEFCDFRTLSANGLKEHNTKKHQKMQPMS